MFKSGVPPVTEILSLPIHYITIETAGSDGEDYEQGDYCSDGNLFLGDPSLQYLAWLGELKIYIIAAAIALVSMPWIASQLDG